MSSPVGLAPDLKARLLTVNSLKTEFSVEGGVVRAVDGVSFSIDRGEIVGVVGESGCGKSATALSLLRLLPKPHGRIAGGSIRFDGEELVALPEARMRQLRGHRIAMIFQDPMTSLNPYLRVGQQLAEVGVLHLGLTQQRAWEQAVALLKRVKVPDASKRAHQYPHELSGGMRQRAMIAMALSCEPDLLIADEPTTALDVTIQAQILELLLDLREERQLSVLLITHDLGVVASTCDRVLVMYAGQVVESAPAPSLFRSPHHPYTRALLGSVPRVDGGARQALEALPGLPPRLDRGPFDACRFAPRCAFAHDRCALSPPPLRKTEERRLARCVLEPKDLA